MELNCEVEGGGGSNELGVRGRVCENYWRNCREGRIWDKKEESRKGREGEGIRKERKGRGGEERRGEGLRKERKGREERV